MLKMPKTAIILSVSLGGVERKKSGFCGRK
jgi:hypothetical protein